MGRRTFAARGVAGVLAGWVLASAFFASSGSAAPPTSASTTTTTLPVVTYNRSCEVTAMTQLAMDRCAGSEFDQLQTQLNGALKREKRRVSARLVNQSERTFAAYRDAECKAHAAIATGGTIYPLIATSCAIELTIQRIQQVESDTRYASL